MGPNERTMLELAAFHRAATNDVVLELMSQTIFFLQAATPILTAHAKSSYTAAVGAPQPGFPMTSSAKSHTVPAPRDIVDAGVGRIDFTDDLFVGNTAGHSGLLAAGLLSPRAPESFVEPSIQSALLTVESYQARVI